MHCVVLTIAESRRLDCNISTALFGPFDSADEATSQVRYLKEAYGRRVLYLRAFDLGKSNPDRSRP